MPRIDIHTVVASCILRTTMGGGGSFGGLQVLIRTHTILTMHHNIEHCSSLNPSVDADWGLALKTVQGTGHLVGYTCIYLSAAYSIHSKYVSAISNL